MTNESHLNSLSTYKNISIVYHDENKADFIDIIRRVLQISMLPITTKVAGGSSVIPKSNIR